MPQSILPQLSQRRQPFNSEIRGWGTARAVSMEEYRQLAKERHERKLAAERRLSELMRISPFEFTDEERRGVP